MPKVRYEAATVYRRKNDGIIIVQPMARHPIGASAAFGDPTEIAPQDFDRRVAAAVLDALRRYHVQVFDRRLAKRFSDEEYAQFIRGHDSVAVTLYEASGLVEVVPCFPEEGSRASRKGHKITFSKDDIVEKLPEALRASFSALERG
jgi:hypothetical protein